MQEAEIPGLAPEVSGENLSETIAAIYLTNPTPQEQEYVRELYERIIDPNDEAGLELYKDLRDSLEALDSPQGWEATKQAARAELAEIPPDYLERILEYFAPPIKNLPPGHGKGHMLRDTINLTGMLNDPRLESEKIDEVELLVGVTAGVFHDIGNSIVERYEDPNRVAAHAEVGAVLFGEVAKDIMPPNLLKLTQYAIAAHTHYPPNRKVELANGTTYAPRIYNDLTGPQGREAIWLARQADRRDMSNFAQLVRDMLVHVRPIQDFRDFGEDSFYTKEEAAENFAVYYGLSSDENQQKIISHEMMYCRNVFRDNPYTSHDDDYFKRKLMTPGVVDFALFLSVIAPDKKDELLAGIGQDDQLAASQISEELAKYSDTIEKYSGHPIASEDIAGAVNKFKHTCRVVEPAAQLEGELELFETQFQELSHEDQESWARAMLFMSDVLFERWRNRLAESVSLNLQLGNKISSQDPAAKQQFEEFGGHLQRIAKQIIASMDQANSQL